MRHKQHTERVIRHQYLVQIGPTYAVIPENHMSTSVACPE